MEYPIKRRFFNVNSESTQQNKSGEVFRILQYNVLAQGLMNRKTGFPYVKKSFARWKYRRANLLKEIENSGADLMCFQEMDYYSDFWKAKLSNLGYESLYHANWNGQKRRTQPWGCVVCFKASKFSLKKYEVIEFNHLRGDSGNSYLESLELSFSHHSAQIVLLEPKVESGQMRRIIITNTHFYWRPGYEWIRMRHLIRVLEEIEKFRSHEKREPLVIAAGDFNLSPCDYPIRLVSTKRRAKLECLVTKEQEIAMKKIVKYFAVNDYLFEHFSQDLRERSIDELKTDRDASVKTRINFLVKNLPVYHSVYDSYCLLDTKMPKNKRYGNEPPYTNFRKGFTSTLDYVLLQEQQLEQGIVEIERILEIPKPGVMEKETALPNQLFSSDHVCLLCEIRVN